MTLDALFTVLGHLSREWGDYGYRVAALHPLGYTGGGAIEVTHSDGSRFFIATDRHGAYVGHGDTLELAVTSYNVSREAREAARALAESEA